MTIWWLLVTRIVINVGLIVKLTTLENILFLGIGTLGIGSYLALLAVIVSKAKGYASEQNIHTITLIFSVFLIGLAACLSVRSVPVLAS